ncbi:MAG: hypothetical protein IPM70_14180 [Proteobacteria bacterium]|nr:hypothetical protein [Pseudomonadota bacterium]
MRRGASLSCAAAAHAWHCSARCLPCPQSPQRLQRQKRHPPPAKPVRPTPRLPDGTVDLNGNGSWA